MIKVKIDKYYASKERGYYYHAKKIKSRNNEISRSLETYLMGKEWNESKSYIDILNLFCKIYYKAINVKIDNYISLENPEGFYFEITIEK